LKSAKRELVNINTNSDENYARFIAFSVWADSKDVTPIVQQCN